MTRLSIQYKSLKDFLERFTSKGRANMINKEVKYGLGNVSVGNYQTILCSEDVCKYVSKHVGKNVDYYIVFKKKS